MASGLEQAALIELSRPTPGIVRPEPGTQGGGLVNAFFQGRERGDKFRRQREQELDEKELAELQSIGLGAQTALDIVSASSGIDGQMRGDARVINFLEARIPEIKKRGGNPRDSQEIVDLFKAGRREEAISKLVQGRDVAASFGALPQEALELTTLTKNLIAAGLEPGTQDFQKAVIASLGPGVETIFGGVRPTPKEKAAEARITAFGKALAGQDATRFKAITDAVDAGPTVLQQISEIESILDSGFETGALTSSAAFLSNLGKSLGLSTGKVAANAEAINSAINKIVLANASALKGALSDRENDLLEKAGPSLGNTVEGNRLILNIMKRAAERAPEIFRQAEANIEDVGSLKGFVFKSPEETKFFSSVQNREVSEQDIQDTLEANPELTREQLFEQLGIQ